MDVGMPSTGCIRETEVLVLYDSNVSTTVSVDASNHALGAVLLQEQANGDVKPVSYTSRSLSLMEEQYAQIEKQKHRLSLGLVNAFQTFWFA